MGQSSDAQLAGPTPPDSFDSLIRAAAAAPAVIPQLPALPEGYELGRYRIVRELGRGGMASVFEAVHRTSGKRVALKIVRDGLALTPTVRQRIEREARLVTTIDHPGVVPVLDVFDTESGWPVLVLELLRGETLADWLRRERRSIRDVARMIADVVAIVSAAHAASVVHRDLKPENVFLAERAEGGPVVRLLDFGIARSLVPDDEGRRPLTRTGALVGTPQYMAPEQLFGESDIDERADVWALGVLLYEAISGKRPIEGANVGQLVRRLGEDGVGKLEPGICPEALRDVIHRMLEPDRSRRFRDLHELERLLRRCARGQLEGGKRPIGAAVLVLAWCVPAMAGLIAVSAPDALPRASAPERAAPSAPQASEAGPRELTFATLFPRTSSQGRLLEAWRRAVNLRSGGRLEVNVQWTSASGIRGSERALLRRLRTGQVDGATVGAKTLPVIYPTVTALALPGVVDTWAKVDGIRESLRDVIAGPPGRDGHRLLAWQDEGCQRFMSRGRPVRRASDLPEPSNRLGGRRRPLGVAPFAHPRERTRGARRVRALRRAAGHARRRVGDPGDGRRRRAPPVDAVLRSHDDDACRVHQRSPRRTFGGLRAPSTRPAGDARSLLRAPRERRCAPSPPGGHGGEPTASQEPRGRRSDGSRTPGVGALLLESRWSAARRLQGSGGSGGRARARNRRPRVALGDDRSQETLNQPSAAAGFLMRQKRAGLVIDPERRSSISTLD